MIKHYSWIIVSVLLSLSLPFVQAQEATDNSVQAVRTISIQVDEDGNATLVSDDLADGDNMLAQVYTTEGSVDGEKRVDVYVKNALFPDTPINMDGGWLGVHLSELSPALSAHLGLKSGVLVVNVIEGSPADEAGLEQWDILLTIDGEPVATDIAGAAEMISSRDPGAVVPLDVLRSGNPIALTATLAERPPMKQIELKHCLLDSLPSTIEEEVTARARVLTQDENGNWVMEDLGDLEEFENLPDSLRSILEQEEATKMVVDQRSFSMTVMSKGDTLSITQDKDGQITVERKSEDGTTEQATYPDAESLEQADPDASQYYSQTLGVAGPGTLSVHAPFLSYNMTTGAPGAPGMSSGSSIAVMKPSSDILDLQLDKIHIWADQMESAFEKLEEGRDMLEKNQHMVRTMKIDLDDKISQMLKDLPSGAMSHISVIQTPDTVNDLDVVIDPAGQTVVSYRSHNASIVETYETEKDFKEGNPALYSLYLDTLAPTENNR